MSCEKCRDNHGKNWYFECGCECHTPWYIKESEEKKDA